MKLRSLHRLSVALAAYGFLSGAAQGQVIPFQGNFGPGLSTEDSQLLFQSVERLNAVEPSRVGRSDAWSNPQTKSHGSSTILKVFQSDGMTCHLVRHHIVAVRPRLATIGLLGAARRAENGKSRVDRQHGVASGRGFRLVSGSQISP
jgi:hypothetical protein